MDEVVLDYYDVRLRARDVLTLREGCWLNDQIITFYFEYLYKNSPTQNQILFMEVSTAFMLLNMPSLIPEIGQQLNFWQQNLILIPINDNPDVDRIEGGSHWSLLVFNVKQSKFVHFDSLSESNSLVAQKFSSYFAQALKLKSYVYQECKNMIQQKNGYDCGMYVLIVAELISQVQSIDQLTLQQMSKQEVEHKRREIQDIIFQLASEKQQQKIIQVC
eukprot:TRINITY_DN11520_c0_g1_i2.p2 TRINITY_DN11520_c0_g1~~TRINITY_DN11520_c0_g1_i2.p2  ORF type:complete len:226 (+),score=13.96 TRINITY_DN11520_c0_g1_i2:27-680(+)